MALLSTLSLGKTRFAANSSLLEMSCYCKVTAVMAGLLENRIEVSYYLEQSASDNKALPIYQKIFAAPGFETQEYQDAIASANGSVYAAIYGWLKQQPDFAGATDI